MSLQPTALQLISRHVAMGFPQQRLSSLAEDILELQAQYCAVLQPKTFRLMGLVRFSAVAANPASAIRILADMMEPPPACSVSRHEPAEAVVAILAEQDPPEVAVTSESGTFVDLITPDSFIRWLFISGRAADVGLDRIPLTSRWNPHGRLDSRPPLPGGSEE